MMAASAIAVLLGLGLVSRPEPMPRRAAVPRLCAVAQSRLRQRPGTPAVVNELAERVKAGESALELVPFAFPFQLDDFQMGALDVLHDGRSVVVSAPTGSGKTLIGEMSIYFALARGQRAIYTTPLKALSNQKFGDLQRQFGHDRVGLLTGDTCINREGSILVMTTEVYRNMLLKESQPTQRPDVTPTDGEPLEAAPDTAAAAMSAAAGLNEDLLASSSESSPLDGVAYVVLDEFHYMNDPSRGTVWEECCILSPPSISLIALSATIANTKQITSWLSAIHGPTALVASDYRPVPLRYYFADNLGVLPLFSSPTAGPGGAPDGPSGLRQRQRQWKLNPKLTAEGRARREMALMRRDAAPKGGAARRGGSRARGGREEEEAEAARSGRGGRGRGGGAYGGRGGGTYGGRGAMRLDREMERQRARQQVPTMPYLLRSLDRQKMLPAIIFIFSRAGCDEAASYAAASRHSLITPQESAAIEQRLAAFRAAHPTLSLDEERLAMLSRGVAAHHAGMLPLEKSLVEALFQENLLKAVFATETLAAGVNMPARCTVVSVISKRGDNGIGPLAPSALLQMAGRAGRRGMDTLGHVVICRSPYEDSFAAHSLLLQPAEPISSHFFVSYGSALQMLRTRSPSECRDIVGRSFGAYLASVKEREATEALLQVDSQLDEMDALLRSYPEEELASYVKLQERLTAERRSLEYLIEQDNAETAQTIESVLPFVQTGTSVLLTDGTPSILIDDAPPLLASRLPTVFSSTAVLLLLSDASLRIAQPNHIAALEPDLRTSPLPVEPREALLASLPPPSAWALTANGSLATAPLRSPPASDVDERIESVADAAEQPAPIDTPTATTSAEGLADDARADPASIPSALQVARGAAAAAAATLALEVQQMATPDLSAGVQKQLARVEWVEAQLQASALHAEPRLERLLEAYRSKAQLEATQARLRRNAARGRGKRGRESLSPTDGSSNGSSDGSSSRGLGLGTEGEATGTPAWRQFGAVCEVLRLYGALDEWTATELGELVAELAGDNELWLALVMLELADKDSLLPEQLAAILSATLDERMRQNAYVGYFASEATLEVIDELQGRADVRSPKVELHTHYCDDHSPSEMVPEMPSRDAIKAPTHRHPRAQVLAEAQFTHGVDFGIGLEAGACALVEAWAKGETWDRLMANTSLDGGDLYRILRRTIELLRCVSAVPYVSEGVKRRASAALRAMNRFPVADGQLGMPATSTMPGDLADAEDADGRAGSS